MEPARSLRSNLATLLVRTRILRARSACDMPSASRIAQIQPPTGAARDCEGKARHASPASSSLRLARARMARRLDRWFICIRPLMRTIDLAVPSGSRPKLTPPREPHMTPV
jgi:hypothetical protein